MKLFFLTLILFSWLGCGMVKIKPDVPRINNQIYTLGPDSLQFCNGWLQVWALVDTTSFQREVTLNLKASPPEGSTWEISNENLIVELPKNTTRRRKLKDVKQIDLGSSHTLTVPGSKSNLIQWETIVEGLDPSVGLTIYFRSFEGCNSKGIIGTTIRDKSFEE